jgi:K+-transporting ATPase A subunit
VGWARIVCFIAVLSALVVPLGAYIARVFARPPTALELRLLRPAPQDWKAYARSAIVFSFVCMLALYGLLRTQGLFPFNPQHLGAGVGLAVAVAVIRGVSAQSGTALGCFWVDLWRALAFVIVLEGKEQRFGVAGTALFAAATTTGSSGAVNGAMESFTGLGGLIAVANMATGEVIFGGIGSGLYGILLTVLLAVFLAGLMVGGTPEYLGKTIGAREIKLVVIGTIGVPCFVLAVTALAVATSYGRASIFASGPQGFAESVYAYVSQAFNNGSAYAGYTGYVQPNAPGNAGAYGITYADLAGGVTMLVGRYAPMIAALSVAGSLAGRRTRPPGLGTLRTDTPTFAVVLIGVIALVTLLTFVPAFMLGPGAQALTGRLF